MEKVFAIKFPVYDYTVNVVVSDDIILSRQSRDKKVGHTLDHTHNEYVEAIHSYGEHPECYLFFKVTASPGTVCHECYHAISRMFRYIGGEEIDEEVMAYHLGYVVDRVHPFINQPPTRKKSR